MPDEWSAESKKTERGFFYAVLITLAREYVENLVLDCRIQRLGLAEQRLLQPRPLSVGNNWFPLLL